MGGFDFGENGEGSLPGSDVQIEEKKFDRHKLPIDFTRAKQAEEHFDNFGDDGGDPNGDPGGDNGGNVAVVETAVGNAAAEAAARARAAATRCGGTKEDLRTRK